VVANKTQSVDLRKVLAADSALFRHSFIKSFYQTLTGTGSNTEFSSSAMGHVPT
jgi:hypothetical protein